MVAYDPRRWPEAHRRLSEEAVVALRAAIAAQRSIGREPAPALRTAVRAAAQDARERAIPPEALLVQLKIVAEEAGVPPAIGDEGSSALREWLVTACVAAYFDGT